MKDFYALLCVVGTVLPFTQFAPWVLTFGLNVPKFVVEAATTPLSAFAWLDIVIAAIALIAFMLVEGRRLAMRGLWLPLLGTLTMGGALGLPWFLLMRELHWEPKVSP